MRQLTCVGKGQIEWRDVPAPTLQGPTEALIRPIAVARCEIDPYLIALYQRGEPFALGHEAVAEIVSLGEEAGDFHVGQRVIVTFQVSCGRCATCVAGHTANCAAYPLLSDYGMQPLSGVEYGGMLSELVRVPHATAMLQPLPAGFAPNDLASVSDNVLDGYRSVAPHLQTHPGADVLFVSHGTPSIALYGIQTALAFGAGEVWFASDDATSLAAAERLGARVIRTDFSRAERSFPIVVDCGVRPEGLHYALRSTQGEGICQSVSYYGVKTTPMPLARLYTMGIQFFIGRTHAAKLLPEVLAHIAAGRLRPAEVTSRVVGWEDALHAYLEPSIKLVVSRAS
jgi:threonine dehydrogenase-like Zn-dependent dehydrogenase